MWVIFAVIVQVIRHAIRLHDLDLVMSVIFSVIVTGNVNGTKKKIAEGEGSRQGNSDMDGEVVYDAAFMASVGSVNFADKECYSWLIDWGASSQMTKEKHVLMSFQEFGEPENVALGGSRVVKALGSGCVQMNMLFPRTETKKAVFYNVLYVPNLTCNLFSVQAAAAKGNVVEFGPNHCYTWN